MVPLMIEMKEERTRIKKHQNKIITKFVTAAKVEHDIGI